MDQLAGLPYCEIQFDKAGKNNPPAQLFPAGTTDLVVISHGWKNDTFDAHGLYEAIITHMLAAGGSASGRTFAVVGVIWPAALFRSDLTLVRDTLPVGDGGAAAMGDADLGQPALKAYAQEVARDLGVADGDGFVHAAIVARHGGDEAQAFVERLRGEASDLDAQDAGIAEEHAALFNVPGGELVDRLGRPPVQDAAPVVAGGGAAGFADDVPANLQQWFSGGRAGVANLLNQFTYYEMKARAGTVGRALAKIIDDVPATVRLHLVGHSFGARLVSAAASAMTQRQVSSLTLLQGAYSHNGLGRAIGGSATNGAFRNIISDARVTGAIAVTHTRQDTAVGFFYALASTITGEVAAAMGIDRLIGGPDDLHGGIGANGALSMGDGETLAHVAVKGQPLPLAARKVNNILSDAIVGDHNDVRNADVGRVVWDAIKVS